jgi:hypothetical protein
MFLRRGNEKKVLTIDKEIMLTEEMIEMAENGFCHHCK